MPPTADEYREGLRLLQQQQRARLTAFIEQVDHALAQDWQRSMGYAAPLYRPLIDQYARDLAALRREMDDPSARLTLDWLTARNAQLRTIEQSVRASLDKYGSASAAKVTQAQAAAAERGAADAAQLTQRSLWPAVEGAGVPPAMLFNRPNPDAIAQWVGRAGNGHPLGDLFANFGAEATQQARKEMLLGLATGANPRAMAKGISNALGISRSRATIISRTEVLGSYRSAAHETYRANSDVINGWLWSAGGNNPCFPAGTLIATKRGRVAIEDVVVGDLVLTHRGQFRRVTEIMSRTYRGPMTTLEAEDGRRVMATASHPFLVERQGQLDWIEAGQLRLSDGVVSEHERTTKIIDHRLSDDPIEGRIRQSHNPVALALEIERLAHIAGSSARVPVDAIDLQHGVERGQIEVNRIAPTTDHELLPIVDSQSLKTEARSPFWLGLTRMASIATDGAEATARYLTRLGTDFLATLKTSEGLRGASALLRAIMPPNRNAHDLATPGTGPERVVVGDGSATDTGSGAVDTTSSLTALDAERVAALRADLLNVVRSNVAVSGAVLPPAAAMISQKHLAALTTNALNGGVRNLPAHGMRVSPLMLGVAGSGAKAPIASRVARGRDIEGDAAVLTDAFHIQSITRIAHHIQQSGLMVFNLEVEGDQTYVANGFAVHNCAMCMGMDGLQFSLEEELVDHPCGRCSAIPITKSWDDILGPWGIDSSDMLETSMGAEGAYETGPERFARMSSQQQRAIIGTQTGYDAYRRGEVSLKDFIGKRPAQDGFPASYYQKSLKEMEIPTGRAGSNLVERSPRLTELERAGNLRLRDFGAPIPVDEMPVWAQQSPASQAVYQILRNGLPWGMREQEAQLLQVNLEQMLKEELPLNVRLAALRQSDVLRQYEQYLNIHVRNITGGASTLERGEVPAFVYRPSKELERALAAARAGEREAIQAALTPEERQAQEAAAREATLFAQPVKQRIAEYVDASEQLRAAQSDVMFRQQEYRIAQQIGTRTSEQLAALKARADAAEQALRDAQARLEAAQAAVRPKELEKEAQRLLRQADRINRGIPFADADATDLQEQAAQLLAEADRMNGGIGAVIQHESWMEQAADGTWQKVDPIDPVYSMFGKDISRDDIARLAGARPGDEIRIEFGNYGERSSFDFTIDAPDGYHNNGTFYLDDGKIVLEHGLVEMPADLRTASSGADILHDLEAFGRLGVSRLDAEAAGSFETIKDGYRGYYTWARLGFTGNIPESVLADVQAQFGSEITTLQDLMAQPGGPAWWKAHGVNWEAHFDFTPGSYSRSVLDGLLRRLNARG